MQGHAARPTEIPFAILHTSHGVMIITHAARAGGVGVAARRLVRRLQPGTAFLHHYSFHHQTRPGNLQKIGSYYKQLAVHFVAAPLVMHDQA